MMSVQPDQALAGKDARHPSGRLILVDRITLGVLLVAAGSGWLLDASGFAVPWRLAVPLALAVVGATLLATILLTSDGGVAAGRRALAWMGATLLVLSLALGVDAPRYAAPVGDLAVAPASGDYPVDVRRSAGDIDVDLTSSPLPEQGSVTVRLGLGNVRLAIPDTDDVRLVIRITAGELRVDGTRIQEGLDLRWAEGPESAPVVVSVEVGAGEVDVRHG